MKRLVDLVIMAILMLLFIVALVMGMAGAWWNLFMAGGVLMVGVALYYEMCMEDKEKE